MRERVAETFSGTCWWNCDAHIAHGVEYEVDCIIVASGFKITTELRRRFGIDPITGRDGRSLYDHWAEGYRTFHGMMSHGFPNQFFTGFTQAGVSANTSAMFDQQGSHIAYVIKETSARGAVTVEPSQQAQDSCGSGVCFGRGAVQGSTNQTARRILAIEVAVPSAL